MVIDNTSTNPVKYIDSNLYVSGKGPTRWFASTTSAHQETWGPAVYGLNRGSIASKEKPEPTPVGVTYVRCLSTDEGALMVVNGEPVGDKQVNIDIVKAAGIPDITAGEYVKEKAI